MVRLSKIYTKVGDGGQTALGDGVMVPKNHPRVEAYGEVDEANATISAAIALVAAGASGQFEAIRSELIRIQNDLFDVGADLCLPRTPQEQTGKRLRVTPEQVLRLEGLIDRFNDGLPALNSFVLPGGTALAAALHLARAAVRRAERRVAALLAEEPNATNPQAMIYLNRLSDLLFVLARFVNLPAHGGQGDQLWKPGENR